MWICTNKAFLSVVAHRDNKDLLLVRARVKGHIEEVFPGAEVFTQEQADYRYRALLPRSTVASAVAKNLMNIEYDNFKNSVRDRKLHDAYLDVWHVMYDMQRAEKLEA